jgi:hypothetical protein
MTNEEIEAGLKAGTLMEFDESFPANQDPELIKLCIDLVNHQGFSINEAARELDLTEREVRQCLDEE